MVVGVLFDVDFCLVDCYGIVGCVGVDDVVCIYIDFVVEEGWYVVVVEFVF